MTTNKNTSESSTMTHRPTLPSDANSSGRSFGPEELELLRQVIDSGTLNCTKGTMVNKLEADFAQWLGVKYCRAASSGTAAIHAALAAVNPEPGDEVITTPITDMGAITPIIYQAAIPVFADVDPLTYNVTAETISKMITDRTRAVIVTHLFGNVCDMDPILELCARRHLPVIEDCAQAYGATYHGRPVGILGTIGCFSLQQGKHMTAGEGGLVVTTSDEGLAKRVRLFVDKAWGYGDPKPDHYFLALNYRMTELQGAVALAQFKKLESMTEQRVRTAQALTEKIRGIPGVEPPKVTPGGTHVYWRYPLRIDHRRIQGGADAFGRKLREADVACAPRYIQKLAYECAVLRDKNTFGQSHFPFEGPHRGPNPVIYDRSQTPGAVEALMGVVVLPWNEKYTTEHVDYIATVIQETASELYQ